MPAAVQRRASSSQSLARRLQHEMRPRVVPCEQLDGLGLAVARNPAFHQPEGVRIFLRKLRGAGRTRIRRIHEAGHPVKAAEDGIHEAPRACAANAPGERHTGINSSVGGHAIERSQLKGAQPEHVAQFGGDTVPSAGNERTEAAVERALLPEDAGRDLVSQPAIGTSEAADGPIERGVEWPALTNVGEDSERGLARGKSAGGDDSQ